MKNLILSIMCISTFSLLEVSSQCFMEDDNARYRLQNTAGIMDFSLDLFRDLFPYDANKNFFFSPYSIWNALTLAYLGSAGNTELELKKVLRHTNKLSAIQLWRTQDFMYEMRQAKTSNYVFRIANRAYFDESVVLRPCIVDVLSKELVIAQLKKQPSESATHINNWVAKITKNNILDLVNPGDLVNSNMALLNAAYFKGIWLTQFKPSKTKKSPFHVSESEVHYVDMMKMKGNFKFRVSEALGAYILELPYSGKAMSMFVLLPPFMTGKDGFSSMVSKLDANTLKTELQLLRRLEIEVSLPKFKLDQTISDELIVSLKNLGIVDLFGSASNMTGFSETANLRPNKSIHKAQLEISEEGTEASAATAFVSFRMARVPGPSEFKCNHPFMFLIYDNVASNIIFLGAYKNPMAS